jgi:hypothetical protein
VSCRRLIEAKVNLNTIRHQLRRVTTMTEAPLRTFGYAAQLRAGLYTSSTTRLAVDRLVNVAGSRAHEHISSTTPASAPLQTIQKHPAVAVTSFTKPESAIMDQATTKRRLTASDIRPPARREPVTARATPAA